MPADPSIYGQQEPVRINTPFESLSRILQVRQQQESARGLAEQRQAIAEQRRAQTDKIAQDNADRAATGEAIRQGGGVRDQTLAWALKSAPNNVQELTEFFDKADASAANIKKLRLQAKNDEADFFGDLAAGAMKNGGTPDALKTALAYAVEQFPDYAESAQKIGAQLANAQPDQVKGFLQTIISQAPSRREMNKPPTPIQRDPTRDLMNPATGEIISAGKPQAPDPPKLGSLEDFIVSYATKRRLKPEQLSAGDKLKAKAIYEAAGRAPASSGDGAKFWVVRDGNQIRISDAQYRPGDLPASTREQGRRLTSGDAGRMADIDEALKLAGNLDFKQGDTGILPYLGGKAPDAVTNLTGFGLEAKKRQGVINLVKQIIGKGLEGGVLRKEDEAKYEKILPTLSDPAEVVQSKIVNMKRTMEQKRSTFLDNLADAGYDTAKQEARGAASGGVKPPPANETPEQRLKRLMGGG